jgi:hypothetical protein
MILPLDRYVHNVGFANYTGRLHQNYTVSACSVPFIKVKITTVEEIPPPPQPILAPVLSSEIDPQFILPDRLRSTGNVTTNPTIIPAAPPSIIPAAPPPFVIVNNFKKDGQFIALNFIVSTSVAVCGMTIDKTPILLPNVEKLLAPEELDDANKFCCKNPRDIVDLFLIDMDPSRRLVETNKHDSTLTEDILNL